MHKIVLVIAAVIFAFSGAFGAPAEKPMASDGQEIRNFQKMKIVNNTTYSVDFFVNGDQKGIVKEVEISNNSVTFELKGTTVIETLRFILINRLKSRIDKSKQVDTHDIEVKSDSMSTSEALAMFEKKINEKLEEFGAFATVEAQGDVLVITIDKKNGMTKEGPMHNASDDKIDPNILIIP